MADSGTQPRRDLARRSIGIERAASLLERGLELASAMSEGAFVSIAAGVRHSLGIKRDGSLWAWGENALGELGFGDRKPRPRPTRVGDESDWAAAAAGKSHSLALKRDGSLWVWGSNFCGELSFGDTKACDRPTRIGDASDWSAVAAGSTHSVALKRDGSLWAWGENIKDVLDRHRLVIDGDEILDSPTRVGDDRDWAAVAIARSTAFAGSHHTLALKRDGSLWAWGGNEYGQLGLGDTENRNRPTPVAVPKTPQPGKPVAIGDPYQGGVVAYILVAGDPGYVAGETHGLIAAIADQVSYPPGIQWVTEPYWGAYVPGTSTDLGSGSANTDKIIAQNGAGSTYAAGLARACTDGGYSDWYLPSFGELNKLYLNRVAIGGFVTLEGGPGYWSSTEYNAAGDAFHQYFYDGDQYPVGKVYTNRVRAVRAF